MAVFWSSILTLTFFFLRKRIVFNKYFGIYNILVLYLFSMGRMLLPLEFSFTKELSIEFVLNPVVCFLSIKIASINDFAMTVGHLLLFLWLSVAFILATRYVLKYYQYNYRLSRINGADNKLCEQILEEVQQSSSRYIEVTVLFSAKVSTPMGFGVSQKKYYYPKNRIAAKSFILFSSMSIHIF